MQVIPFEPICTSILPSSYQSPLFSFQILFLAKLDIELWTQHFFPSPFGTLFLWDIFWSPVWVSYWIFGVILTLNPGHFSRFKPPQVRGCQAPQSLRSTQSLSVSVIQTTFNPHLFTKASKCKAPLSLAWTKF